MEEGKSGAKTVRANRLCFEIRWKTACILEALLELVL